MFTTLIQKRWTVTEGASVSVTAIRFNESQIIQWRVRVTLIVAGTRYTAAANYPTRSEAMRRVREAFHFRAFIKAGA